MVVYKNGDLLKSNCNVICHQCNCLGSMGSGIARQIRDMYPSVYNAFKLDYEKGGAKLGNVLFVEVSRGLYVANMYSQYDYYPRTICHTDYNAFREALLKIKARFAGMKYIKIGFPYNIGCGLAGGDWNVVSALIEEIFGGDEWSVEIWKI